MNIRRRLVALHLSAALSAFSLVNCGSYDDKPATATTGMTASTATMDSASSSAATTGDAGTPTSTASTATATTGGESSVSSSSSSSTGAGGATSGTHTATTGALDASCENVSACGGDVVGSWYTGGSCLAVSDMADISGFGLGCFTVPVEGTLQVTGMVTFNADGTYTDNTVTTGDITFHLPPECLMVSGTTTTCDRVGGPAQTSLGFASLACEDDTETGGCICPGTVNQEGAMAFVNADATAEGTYTSANNVITVETEDYTTEYTYCVADNILTMSLQSTPKPGPVTGTVALQKQ